jgi:hypothetical protein
MNFSSLFPKILPWLFYIHCSQFHRRFIYVILCYNQSRKERKEGGKKGDRYVYIKLLRKRKIAHIEMPTNVKSNKVWGKNNIHPFMKASPLGYINNLNNINIKC